MRLSRLLLLGLVVGAVSACDDEDTSITAPPPLAQVRFIHGASGTGAVDITMIDQVPWSAKAVTLAYRAATEYWPTEAKARTMRVFLTSLNPAITSQVLHEATVSLTAGSRVTLLLTGTTGNYQLRVIEDDVSNPGAGNIGLRFVNASTEGAKDAYYVASTGTAISGTPQASGVASFGLSAYTTRAAGAVAVRVTPAGTPATVNASTQGPTAPAAIVGAFPGAGVNSAGTRLSAYYFNAGSGANASLTTPGVVFFVDRNPAD